MTMKRRFVFGKFLVCGLALALLPGLAGCLVIERKHLVMAIPGDSKTIQIYYVFEGLSVLENSDSSLREAKGQMMNLKEPNFSFFANGSLLFGENPFSKHFRFEPLRFFRDPSRKRQLCADRRAVILERDQFAKKLNESITTVVRRFCDRKNVDAVRAEIQKERDFLSKEDSVGGYDEFGLGPLVKATAGILELAEKFDNESIERITAETKATGGFDWLQFEPGEIRLVFPTTKKCAEQIVEDPKTAKWIEDMQTFVKPLRLSAGDEGLAIVLGTPEAPVRLTYADARGFRPQHEKDLIEHAGNPGPVLIDGKAATASALIEQFVTSSTKGPE